jgi:dTMP kinase
MPFIVLEGIDSSGKGTQTELLLNKLKTLGKDVEIVSFPRYDTKLGNLVGTYLRGELGEKESLREVATILFALDRYQFKDELKEKLEKGRILIANRYTQSNMGVQAAKFDGDERLEFIDWIKKVESRLPQPDMVIFLDVPVENAAKMIERRGDKEYLKGKKKDIHEQDLEFQKKSRETYLQIAEMENWSIIDCMRAGELRKPEDIHSEIWENVRNLIEAQS